MTMMIDQEASVIRRAPETEETGPENGEPAASAGVDVAPGSATDKPRVRMNSPSRHASGQRYLETLAECFWQQQPRRIKPFMDSLERHIILNALECVFGNQREAAKILGLKFTTLNAKIKKYRIVLERRYRYPRGWSR